MTFPKHDQYWLDTLIFLQENLKYGDKGDKILAPIEFSEEVKGVVHSYECSLDESNQYQWLVIHKGRISELQHQIIYLLVNNQYIPIFANEVFVILCMTGYLKVNKIEENDPHFLALTNQLQQAFLNIKPISKHPIDKKRITNVSDIGELTRDELENISFDNCQTAYIGNNTIICRVLGKYIFYCDAEDTNIVPHFALQGYWETWITLVIARVVKKGWNCIDIGANHGYYSVIMADTVSSSGRLVAIEPNPKLAKLLKQTINVNGVDAQTKIIQKAVLDVDAKTVELVLPNGRGLNATVISNITSTDKDNYSFEVETITVDSLTADWPSVDFIKIDAEGAEEKIWKGMTETIRRNQNISILLEFNCQRYSSPRQFLEGIQASGFKLRYVDVDASIKDLDIEKCLIEKPHEDVMLFLQKN